MLNFLRELRQLTSTKRGCTRMAYTDLECQAHDLFWRHASSIDGLARAADAAGNMFVGPKASFTKDGPPLLLVGSHLDTVIEGGWLDGSLGVAAGLHVLREAALDGKAHANIGVVIFRDEEGVRFNNGLFGSRVFAGMCSDDDLNVEDQNGQSVRSVVPDPEGCLQYVPPVKVAGFLECHIEQGRRLEDRRARIGVVEGIVGIRRYAVRSSGVANHAGTTEMNRRKDALIPMCKLVSELPVLVADWGDAVITCGRLTVAPGAPNVVPGSVDSIVEVRAQTTHILDTIEERFMALVSRHTKTAMTAGVDITVSRAADIAPVHTDAKRLSDLRGVLTETNISFTDLPSMAGHDTQHAALVCPAAMFFIPSIDGVSHNPTEDSREDDIVLAGTVMHDWVMQSLLSLGIR